MLRLLIKHLAEDGQEEEIEIGNNLEMEGHLSSPLILYIYHASPLPHTERWDVSAQSPPAHRRVSAKSPLIPL